MAVSRVPLVLDALLARVAAWPALVAANADPDPDRHVHLVDGDDASGDATDAIFIGYDADPETAGEGASSRFEWAGLGAKARNEFITVVCSIVCSAGDDTPEAVRNARLRAYELFGWLGDAVHADPSLGLPPPCVARVAEHRLIPLGQETLIICPVTVETRP